MNPPKDQYPNALEVIRQITNLTKGQDCIYRGESSINFGYPCSSTLYRQLRKEDTTPGNIPGLLKQRQDERIKANRKYKDMGDNDLERLMSFRHFGAKLNLLDFTETHLVALFFVCFEQDKLDEDGLIVVKQKSDFRVLETEGSTLPDQEIVLLEPHEDLKRARDQHGVFLHAPEGKIVLKPGEAVLIKRENKREILSFLEKEHISEATMFRDAYSEIERWNREDEERVAMATQSATKSMTRLQGFAKPKDNRNSLIMEYYVRLLGGLAEGIYSELLNNHADILIANFTNVLKYNPRDAEAYYNRAIVYQSKPNPDYDQAISDYTSAVNLKSNYTEAYYNRGLAYLETPSPDYDQANLDFSRALGANSDFAEAYSNRGATYAAKSPPDFDKAMEDYDRAIELNPNLAEAYFNRGIAYTKKSPSNFDLAVKNYNRAIELNPQYAEAYLNRGTAHFWKPSPNYTQAISDYSYAIELKPRYAMAYNNRGIVFSHKQFPDYDKAIEDYDRAIKLNPEYVEAYLNRGVTHFSKPRPDYVQAISDLNRAITIDRNIAQAYRARADLYAKLGDCEKAYDDYKSALEINPQLNELPMSPELERCVRIIGWEVAQTEQ